jgi:hypothetical protein
MPIYLGELSQAGVRLHHWQSKHNLGTIGGCQKTHARIKACSTAKVSCCVERVVLGLPKPRYRCLDLTFKEQRGMLDVNGSHLKIGEAL